MRFLKNDKYVVKIKYRKKYLAKLIEILRRDYANYNIDSKKRTVTVHNPSKKIRNGLVAYVNKHQTCVLCKIHRATYNVEIEGKQLKVCGFCLKERNLKGERISYALHHDISTGMLVLCE